MNIGTKIRLLRKEKRVTQEELAEYLHISSQAVSKWETGVSNPDIDFLPKLAIFFGTSLDNLLDFDQSQVDAAVEALIAESGRGGKDPAASEAFCVRRWRNIPTTTCCRRAFWRICRSRTPTSPAVPRSLRSANAYWPVRRTMK